MLHLEIEFTVVSFCLVPFLPLYSPPSPSYSKLFIVRYKIKTVSVCGLNINLSELQHQ